MVSCFCLGSSTSCGCPTLPHSNPTIHGLPTMSPQAGPPTNPIPHHGGAFPNLLLVFASVSLPSFAFWPGLWCQHHTPCQLCSCYPLWQGSTSTPSMSMMAMGSLDLPSPFPKAPPFQGQPLFRGTTDGFTSQSKTANCSYAQAQKLQKETHGWFVYPMVLVGCKKP